MPGSPFDDLLSIALSQLRAEALRRRTAEPMRAPRQCGQTKQAASLAGARKPKTHKSKRR